MFLCPVKLCIALVSCNWNMGSTILSSLTPQSLVTPSLPPATYPPTLAFSRPQDISQEHS